MSENYTTRQTWVEGELQSTFSDAIGDLEVLEVFWFRDLLIMIERPFDFSTRLMNSYELRHESVKSARDMIYSLRDSMDKIHATRVTLARRRYTPTPEEERFYKDTINELSVRVQTVTASECIAIKDALKSYCDAIGIREQSNDE